MYPLLKRALFLLGPETAHDAIKALSRVAPLGAIRPFTRFEHSALETRVGATALKNPIGLAAGFDKNADMLPFLEALGFGFIELGSVTAFPCLGTPKPRIARLSEDESLINWMGLPNVGVGEFAKRVQQRQTTVPIGINIAKTPDFAYNGVVDKPKDGIADFLATYEKTARFGDYTVFNLSCPNTGEARSFEDLGLFHELGTAIGDLNVKLEDAKPVYLKISPDLDQKNLTRLVEAACELGFDGFVVSNTTRQRPAMKTTLTGELRNRGGLSGRALTGLSLTQLKRVHAIVDAKRTLIAVGGIMSFDDLLERLRAGAHLCQIYTGLIYNGPLFVKELNTKLANLCEERGYKSYRELSQDK